MPVGGSLQSPPPHFLPRKPLLSRHSLHTRNLQVQEGFLGAPMGQFNLLYFAAASSYTKKSSEKLEAPIRLSKLFETLESKYPGITDKVLSSSAVTVNLEYVDLEDDAAAENPMTLKEGDEVAIIPPVSSG